MDSGLVNKRGAPRARPRTSGRAGLLLIVGLASLAGCLTPESMTVLPNREATIGVSRDALLACAGQPTRQTVEDPQVVLQYYKEAEMLEESFPGSKGSFPRPHRGCWASVVLEGNRISDIGYQSVPSTIDAIDQCEAIFAGCNP